MPKKSSAMPKARANGQTEGVGASFTSLSPEIQQRRSPPTQRPRNASTTRPIRRRLFASLAPPPVPLVSPFVPLVPPLVSPHVPLVPPLVPVLGRRR